MFANIAVTKCYSPTDADPYGSALNFYAITLAPSTICGEYVVVDDVYYDVLKHPLPVDARPVYVGEPKTRHHAPDSHDKSLKLPPFVLSKNLTSMVVVEPGIKLSYAALLVN